GNRTLIIYGGEDLYYDIPLRRLYLALLRQVWQGWEIHWAEKGIVEMAEYVDFPRDEVIGTPLNTSSWLSLDEPKQRDWVDIVGSLRLEDGSLRLFPLPGRVTERLRCGPELVELARATPGLETLDLVEWGSSFPRGGFHLDPAARLLLCWSSSEHMIEDIAREHWPGWEVRWLRGSYEEHQRLLGERLRLPHRPLAELIADVQSHLLADESDPTDIIRFVIKESERADQEISVNPLALQYDPQHVSHELKAAIWARALHAWREAGAR
ncbi:MAG TPA: hypothetical protein VD886_05755, partial [Herpetosiphonaceae bacterium]|nr:hypothetical protein [Herpetosiphonaceae bacterium]